MKKSSMLVLSRLLPAAALVLAALFAAPTPASANGSPEITVSPSTLTGFETPVGTPSSQQSFTVNATSLTDNVTVTATGDFEVSTTTSTGSFSTTLSLPQSAGQVNAVVYTRITATAPVGPASGNVTVASTAATEQIVSVNGTVNGPLVATITAQPIQTRAGSPIIATQPPNPTFPRIQITSNGTAVSGATVNVTVNTGNFTGNSTTSATTDAGGNATFSNLVLTQAAAGYTLIFTAEKTNFTAGNATSSQFPIIAAAAANATLTTAPGNATYGSALTPAALVTLTDIYGNPVSNTNISALLNNGGSFTGSSNATVRTTTNGTATFSNLVPAQAGNFTVSFNTSAAGVPNVTSNVTISPLATTLTIGNATMQAASSLPSDLVVTPDPTLSATAFSQSVSDVLGNFTYTSSNTTAVGNHTLSLIPGGNGTAANYAITYANGTLTVTAGNASQLLEQAAPVTTEAGRPIEGVNLDSFAPEPPTIFIGDEFGNPVSGITVNASLSTNPGGATLNGTTSLTTGSNGTAVFDDLVITEAAEGYKLSYEAAGLTTLTSEEFNIEPAAAGNITVTTQPGDTTAGVTIPGSPSGFIAVQVFDEYGNAVNRAYNIEATLLTGNFTGNSTTTVLTDATGFGTFESLATNISGVYQIEFAPLAAGNITVTSSNFTVDPDFASANISVTTQPGNSTAGESIVGPPTAQILDQYGNAIPGYTVDVVTNSNTGSFTGTTSETTDATGTASFSNLSQTFAQSGYTLTFSFANATTASNSATSANFTVDPAAAASLVMVTNPSATAQAGIAIPQQPAVRLQDEFGNNVFDTGTSIGATVNEVGGAASVNAFAGGNTTASTVNGTATFSGLSINGTIGDYILEFSSGTLATANSTTVELTAGAPAQLSVSTEPSSTAMANATFSQQPVVQVLDEWSNFVSTDNSTVVGATLNAGSLTGTLTGTANATASGGTASFGGLAITGQVGDYTLSFSATGLTGDTSETIAITPDLTTANISVSTQPGNSTAGESISGPPAAQILDQYGNAIADYTVDVVTNSNTGSFTGTKSETTDASGIASFTDLEQTVAGTPYTLTFSFNATTPTTASASTTSTGFTVDPAAPSKLVMVTEPSATAQAGIAIPQQPAVRLQDEFSNNVLTSGTSVSASANGGNGSTGGTTTATTDGSGTATFSGLSINGTIGDYTLEFTSGVLDSANSTTVELTAGAPAQLSVSTEPSSTAMANATFSQQPVVQVLDEWSNFVSTDNSTVVGATLDAGSLNGNLSGTASATASGGNASFSGLAITGQAGNYTLSFSSGILTNATSSTIEITPDLTTANITITTQPGNTTAGSAIPTPEVSILDQYNNPVGNYTVNATLNGATLTSNSTRNATTSASGNASFSNLITNTSGTGYTLTFSFNATTPTTASNSTTSANFTVSPDTASGLVMVSQPPETAQAGVPFDDANAPQVRLKDRFNNNVPQANMTISAIANGLGVSGNASGSTDALTDETGTATFYGLGISGTEGVYTLTFSNSTLTSNATSNNVTLEPGLPVQVIIATQPPATTLANATLTPSPEVRLQDTWGNNVTTSNITVDAALQGSGATLDGTASVETAAGGLASFGNLRIQGQVGDYTLLFTSGNLSNATSSTIEVTPDLTTATISVTTQPGNSTAGVTIVGPPTAQVLDQYGNAIADYTVDVVTNSNTGSFTGTKSGTTDSSGTASFGNLTQTVAGTPYTLSFSFNATTPTTASASTTSTGFTVDPAAPSKLVMVTEPSATAQAGIAIPQQPAVRLQDEFSNNVLTSGTSVSASANGGNGSTGGTTTATTDGSGTATFSGLTINGTIGDYTLDFASTGLTSATSQTVELTAGDATKLVVSTQPATSVAAGDALDPQPAVRLQDAWSNDVSQTGLTVNATVTSGNASTGGNTAADTDAGGVATFDGLTLAGTIGNYTLTFNATGLADATSDSVEITANPATAVISISTNATDSTAGETIAGPPAATIVDGSGNALSGISVTAAINQNSGNFTGTTSVDTDSSGVASFTDLVQTVAASDYNLTLSFDNTLTNGNATTANFTVNPAAAAALTITTQPASTAQAGIALTTQPVIQVRDAFGNAKPESGLVITSTVNEVNAVIGVNGNATTDGNGTATFDGLTLEGTVGNYTLDFASTGLTSATSDAIELTAGDATKLVVSTQPATSVAAGDELDPQPAVRLQDAWDNNVSQSSVTVTATVTSGAASTSGNTTADTETDGVASFAGLTLNGTVGNYTLTFNATGLADATSDSVEITANPATAVISISTNATTSVAGQTIAGPPAATIVDGFGNALSGISVTAAINQNSGSFTGTTSVDTDATGVASFGNLTQTVAATDYNLMLAFDNGLTNGNATTANFSVTAAAAANMTVVRQPTNTIAGVVIAGNSAGTFPTVRLRDSFGNDVASQNVTVTLQTGTLGGTLTVATNAAGNATFSDLVCTTAGFYRMSFASGNLSVLSNGFNIFAGSATNLVLTNTLQATAQAGITLDPQPIIQVRDTFGNDVSGNRSITVAASTGGLNGNTTVSTNSNGSATFSGLALTGLVGNRTLSFSSSGLTTLTSDSIELTAGPAASLVVTVEPASAFIAGNELTGPAGVGFPTVTLEDAYGNPVSATINATGVGFTAFGNGSVSSLPTDGDGTAVFTNLQVVQAGSGQRVNFASGDVSANTETFNVFPGDPVSMIVSTQPPATVASGVILSPNPAVTLKDAFENTVTSLYDVEVMLGSGNGTLSGTTSLTTTSGVASFTDLSIAELGNYTLSFRTLGYDPELSATSDEFSVASPLASGLAITGISAVDATTYEITFTAEQGGNYWIQKSTDLTLPWTYVSDTASTAVTGANTVTVTAEPGNKTFWRLTTQQPADN